MRAAPAAGAHGTKVPLGAFRRRRLHFRVGGIALERYDLVIVGGGAAGINALKTAVTLGARTVLVDRGPLGGTCVNRG